MNDSFDDLYSLPTSGKEWDLATVKLIVMLMRSDVSNLRKEFEDYRADAKEEFAPRTEVAALRERVKLPITMVYATAGLVLTAVLGALVALVVKGHGGG